MKSMTLRAAKIPNNWRIYTMSDEDMRVDMF